MTIGLVAILFGVAAFASVYAIAAPVRTLPHDGRNPEDFGVRTTQNNPGSAFEKYVRPMVHNFLPQTPMSAQLKARGNDKVVELLVRSGNPWNIQPEEFLGIRILSAIAGFFVFLALGLMEMLPTMLPFEAWLLVGPLLGGYLPKVLLDRHKGARLKAARKGLPEALDLLVITLNAGMNFTPALTEVVGRLPQGVIREELGRVSQDLRAGRPLKDALLDFARRAPSEEAESFAKAVVTSERLGSSVSETLKSQSETARVAYEAALDVKIGKLPTTLYFPILALMLPALFIVILAPAFANIATAF